MKKLILSISAIFFVSLISAQTTEKVVAEEKSEITFVSLEHNYGSVEFNANGTCVFEYTNTGKIPLVLNDVRASCGCTAPEWSREPLKPSDKGKITVKYNTMLVGPFQKSITVYSNAGTNPVVLIIKGDVKPQQPTQSAEQK